MMNDDVDPPDRQRRGAGTWDAQPRGGVDIHRMNRRHQQPQRSRLRNLQLNAVSDSNLEWFRGAPISKGILFLSIVLYFVVTHYRTPSMLDLWRFNSLVVFKRQQRYRFISSKFFFGSNIEEIVGTSLQFFLYRKFEREFGSFQFLKYVLAVYILTLLQEIVLFQWLTRSALYWSYCGPYCVLSALFLYYHWYIPRLHPRFVSVFNFHFSEKSLYYFWYLYLLIGSNRDRNDTSTFSSWYGTIISVLMGMIASTIYHLTSQNRYLLLLDRTVRLTLVQPIIHRFGFDENNNVTTMRDIVQHPTVSAIATNAGQQRLRQRHPQNVTPAPTQAAVNNNDNNWMQEIPLPEPDMAAVEQLTAMGFPQPQVIEALRQSHNNVEHAANRLLSGE
jgi:membrane associated rhomboid family serine protease